VREFTAGLTRMYPGFGDEDIDVARVSRVREMLAVSTLGYSARHAPPVRTSVPNLYIVNSAQIANGTLNVNETIGLAHGRAPEILEATASMHRTELAGAA
jgi:hypothetical protein